MKLVYICRTGFKNGGPAAGGGGGLGSSPSLKIGSFQSGHSREKQVILELKIPKKRMFYYNEGLFDLPRSENQNKEFYIFEKGSFGAVQVENVESLGAAKAEKWGKGGGLSRGKYPPFCPYMGIPPRPHPTPTPTRTHIHFYYIQISETEEY